MNERLDIKNDSDELIAIYLYRTELTHRMRMVATWREYSAKYGIEKGMTRSFKRLSVVHGWADKWSPPAQDSDAIKDEIDGHFTVILKGQAKAEACATDTKIELAGIMVSELLDYHNPVGVDGEPLEGQEAEDRKDAIIKRIGAIASVIKKLQMERTFYERATELYE